MQILRKELRQKYGVGDKQVVLFVGRLSAVKGPDILIKAMHQIIEKYDESVLVIVGSKWFSEDSVDEYGLKLYEFQKNSEKTKYFHRIYPPERNPYSFFNWRLICL